MFVRKVTIAFALLGIATALGFICGVAPGVLAGKYVVFGFGCALLVFICIFLVTTVLIFEYQNKNQAFSTPLVHTRIFHKRLARREKILLLLAYLIMFAAAASLGVLCALLLKTISASLLTYMIIGAVFISILFLVFLLILILAVNDSRQSKVQVEEQYPLFIASDRHHTQEPTKPQNGPTNTAERINRYHARHLNDHSSSTWQYSSLPDPTNNSANIHSSQKPASSIHREYQKLLRPSPRYYVNEKVYVNDNDLAQIIEVDGLGNYTIRYFDTGLVEFRNGADLRKALPLIT